MGRYHPKRRLAAGVLALGMLLGAAPAAAEPAVQRPPADADAPAAAAKPAKAVYAERKALFDQMSAMTGIPWYDLAAVDQYERTLNIAKKRPAGPGLIGIFFTPYEWAGPANPNPEDQDARTVALFGGRGMDGDGDGKADRHNDMDLLHTMTRFLLKHGVGPEQFKHALMEYYRNPRAVERIQQFSRLYSSFQTLELHDHAFPLPLGSDYSYRSTWGASRGWGGHRIHEGTDLFAHYGVPVRSTCYGIIEVMGWNPYGGWRVGIRDIGNVYHYYAHLSGFNKQVRAGDLVKPGQVVGWVGSSGYGKPGTSGKFPPHLHYGMYRDNGTAEWSFDPYPQLRRWEQEERLSRKKK
ncbi:M23 family metallopeptidase [Gorillibacterium sp. sgz5001074]|uniref:M23 family metallopeptidase n=1 Tax=Gorillibacterium sp. sgz5001074 TaxID=3446695 RepID=UPI003F67506B